MCLFHVAYAGNCNEDSSNPVSPTVEQALQDYGWFRVVEAEENEELAAIQLANKETDDTVEYGEVYFVTPFVSQPTRKVEVIVTV